MRRHRQPIPALLDVPSPAPVLASAPVVALALVLALALGGCTGPAPAPSPSLDASATPSASSAPVTPVAPVVAPTPLPGEIARVVITPTQVDSTSGDVPARTASIYLHAACSGAPGSTMHVELHDAGGTRFGPGSDVVCSGEETVTGSAGTDLPATAQVVGAGDPGVTGWAVLSTSAEH